MYDHAYSPTYYLIQLLKQLEAIIQHDNFLTLDRLQA